MKNPAFDLIQRLENYILRPPAFVNERPLDLVQVVEPDGGQSALPAQVVVQLLLQVNEPVVGGLIEPDVTDDGGEDVGTDVRDGRPDGHGLWVGDGFADVLWGVASAGWREKKLT